MRTVFHEARYLNVSMRDRKSAGQVVFWVQAGKLESALSLKSRRCKVVYLFVFSVFTLRKCTCAFKVYRKKHRVGRGLSLFQSLELGLHQPLARRRVFPPHPLVQRGWESPNSKRGDIHCGTLYMYVLCERSIFCPPVFLFDFLTVSTPLDWCVYRFSTDWSVCHLACSSLRLDWSVCRLGSALIYQLSS